MPRPHRRYEIDRKTPHVERIDERNDPFADRRPVVVFLVAEGAERDCEAELDEDEG
jgi:hypothetical protein